MTDQAFARARWRALRRIMKMIAITSTGSDAKKGAIGAGAGAIVGGIAGGGSGAAIGGAIGGAGAILATKGKEVEVPAGTMLTTKLVEPVKLLVPIER